MHAIPYPPSVPLARRPTPLEPLSRLSGELGVELLCKRDDLTGAALSGNKVRKLEFSLAEAERRGAGAVITCGGAQSNHARATAVAAAMRGLGCHLLLRTDDPGHPPRPTGNVLLDRLVGARVRWISAADYARRDTLLPEQAARLSRETGRPVFPIPEGASDALGAFGYVRCAEELCDQLGRRPATVVCAVGSGGTLAGLLAGCTLLELPYRVVGVCVTDDRATFQTRVDGYLRDMEREHGLPVARDRGEIEIWEDYVGRGYARSRPEELALIGHVARTEGLVLDPVYTGKAFFGLTRELHAGRSLPGPVVFLHTGGIFGLFSGADDLTEIID